MTSSSSAQAAERLILAAEKRMPCAPVRDLIGPADIDEAYATQVLVNTARMRAGAQIVGRKIGLTSPAVQAQLGVDRPDFGVLFDDMEVSDGQCAAMDRLLQPKVEAEIAFVLGRDLDGALDDITIREAVESATVALEIVDSRIENWNITFADTVADNASSGMYALGNRRLTLADFEPRDTSMRMLIDQEVVSSGTGAACLGDPLEALRWLARTAQDFGDPLRAGQVVLSGALGPMAPVAAGQTVRAELTTSDGIDLGSVTVTFSQEAQ